MAVDRSFRRSLRRSTAVVAAAALALLAGCDPPAPSPTTGDTRIVSLSPAISRTLADLGLDADVVGRTPYCTALDGRLPVVGDLHDLDLERLIRLDPTHVLVQPAGGVIAPDLAALAEEHGWHLAGWRLDGLADIGGLLDDLPAVLGRTPPRLDDLRSGIARLARPRETPGPPPWTGRTLILAGVDPPRGYGPGTYLDDLLVREGATNVLADRASGWIELSLEDLARLEPEAIILVDPDGPPERPARWRGGLETLAVPAVRDGRLGRLVHRDALLPSTGLIEVAEELRAILEGFAGTGP